VLDSKGEAAGPPDRRHGGKGSAVPGLSLLDRAVAGRLSRARGLLDLMPNIPAPKVSPKGGDLCPCVICCGARSWS